jgi:two-component SAPR family response regulator
MPDIGGIEASRQASNLNTALKVLFINSFTAFSVSA